MRSFSSRRRSGSWSRCASAVPACQSSEMPRRFITCDITTKKMRIPKNPTPPTPVENRNPIKPRKSPDPDDPPELPLPRDLELELELERELELEELRELELEPLDRDPLKELPPPGRAASKNCNGAARCEPPTAAGVSAVAARALASCGPVNAKAAVKRTVIHRADDGERRAAVMLRARRVTR